MRTSLPLKALALAAAVLEGVHSFDMVKLKRIAEMVSPVLLFFVYGSGGLGVLFLTTIDQLSSSQVTEVYNSKEIGFNLMNPTNNARPISVSTPTARLCTPRISWP